MCKIIDSKHFVVCDGSDLLFSCKQIIEFISSQFSLLFSFDELLTNGSSPIFLTFISSSYVHRRYLSSLLAVYPPYAQQYAKARRMARGGAMKMKAASESLRIHPLEDDNILLKFWYHIPFSNPTDKIW